MYFKLGGVDFLTIYLFILLFFSFSNITIKSIKKRWEVEVRFCGPNSNWRTGRMINILGKNSKPLQNANKKCCLRIYL